MVIATVGVVAVIASGGSLFPAAAVSAGSTAGAGAGVAVLSLEGSTIAMGAAGGACAGAIAGASSAAGAGTATIAAARSAAVIGTAAGVAVTASVEGAQKKNIGKLMLGAENNDGRVTWDCWKPLLHDNSPEPSNGMQLGDVMNDKRIENITFLDPPKASFPRMILENVWGEKFAIDYILLSSGQIASHARMMF